jgi:hypothetical protein
MINPRVKSVKPLNDYSIQLTFDNDEVKIFDVRPYLDKGVFTQLKDQSVFNSVRPFMGAVQWNNGLDFGPDTLYLEGISVKSLNERHKS